MICISFRQGHKMDVKGAKSSLSGLSALRRKGKKRDDTTEFALDGQHMYSSWLWKTSSKNIFL